MQQDRDFCHMGRTRYQEIMTPLQCMLRHHQHGMYWVHEHYTWTRISTPVLDSLRDRDGKCRRPGDGMSAVNDSYAHRIKRMDLDDICWHPKHHIGYEKQWHSALRYILQSSPSPTHTSREGVAHLQRHFPSLYLHAFTLPHPLRGFNRD